LVHGDLANLVLVRLATALLHTRGLQQQLGGRRGLQLEVEGAVFVNGDLDRHHIAALVLGRGVVGLAELHDVDAVLTQSRTNWRRRVSLTSLDLQLDDRCQLLLLGRHFASCVSELSGYLLRRSEAGPGEPMPARPPLRGSPANHRTAPTSAEDVGQILETWLNDSSTGVSRPKIDTSTLSFWVSGLTSLIVAGKVANGPSMTVTDSPTSKSTSTVG